MKIARALLLSLLLTLTLSCGSEESDPYTSQPSSVELFGPGVHTVELEVDYMTGAEPYVGEAGPLNDVWTLFGDNAQRMFAQANTRDIHYPNSLAQMEELTEVSGQRFNSTAILDIAAQHRDKPSQGSVATFYVLWLQGYFVDQDGQERRDVLGVSLGDTGVIAMFKPVIEGSALPGRPGLVRFVEQTTLIHEFGHAAGLVNRGVPLASDHHDEAHGAHCTQQSCVMYYAHEGLADLRDFALTFLATGETVVFGDACLRDMDELIQSQQ